jgi:nucleotide-binding universal stress UspA family protein
VWHGNHYLLNWKALMAIKRILLPFCDPVGFKPIGDAAFVVGQFFSAQVRGLFAQSPGGPLFLPDQHMSMEQIMHIIERISRERDETLRLARELFEECSEQFGNVETEFVAGKAGAEEAGLGAAVRLADLAVLGSGARYAGGDWGEMRDAALFGSGRPALFVPPSGLDQSSFERVVIAWKDGIEAARAIAAAQPFLELAKEVHVVTVGEVDQSIAALREVEQYLQLHHTNVRSSAISAARRSVGEALLDRCEALGRALLVMGAYGHWRWRERVFGGVTEHVLYKARVPVLMMH